MVEDEDDESLAEPDLVPLVLPVPLVPPRSMLVVLELVAVLPAVLPLPLVAPLLLVVLGEVVVLPEAVVPLAPACGAVAVLPDFVSRVLPLLELPMPVVVVSEPLVLAAAPD
jgi:hypothetical protein